VTSFVIGIFVGGAGKRMGGVAKGLLEAPARNETLIERLVRVCAEAAPAVTPHLVGRSDAYAALRLPQIDDDPSEIGPIGGLRGLLLHAKHAGAEHVLALACDLPFIDVNVLRLLCAPLVGPARVPFVAERFQPLAAAYAPEPTLSAVDRAVAQGKHALMAVLAELGPALERVEESSVRAEALRDWDTPDDVTR
jgi:molybdopterin-guanine dinucleotide biosynthesis protein A